MKQVTSDDRRQLQRVGWGDNRFFLCEDGQNEAISGRKHMRTASGLPKRKARVNDESRYKGQDTTDDVLCQKESGIQCRGDTTDTFSPTLLGLAIVADDCTDFSQQN